MRWCVCFAENVADWFIATLVKKVMGQKRSFDLPSVWLNPIYQRTDGKNV